jgi:hypothetical protein
MITCTQQTSIQRTHLQNIICSASNRLGRIGLAAGSYKLLKDKALVLVVHTLSKYQPI